MTSYFFSTTQAFISQYTARCFGTYQHTEVAVFIQHHEQVGLHFCRSEVCEVPSLQSGNAHCNTMLHDIHYTPGAACVRYNDCTSVLWHRQQRVLLQHHVRHITRAMQMWIPRVAPDRRRFASFSFSQFGLSQPS